MLIASAALLSLSACASAPPPPPPDHKTVTVSDSFVAAETRLREAIGARDLTLFTIIDHSAGATLVGRDIGQSKLFIFGNPKGGTPLIQAAPQMGLDLPLKILIYTDEAGRTAVSYTNIKALAAQHRIEGQDARLDTIADMLRAVARETAG
ncbi:DUF302 domain-containing protein [Algimonas arctica]|uniref:DUF302 domain-containing protein n=1 Tax=Algimonas arctica TaxID=1479486 RepID=UPI0016782D62|nr:DUF302 domain-containing protein [Algimonas arctica]